MKEILADIQSGKFTKEFIDDSKAGAPKMKAFREAAAGLQSEQTGASLREMMPWIARNKLVDKKVA